MLTQLEANLFESSLRAGTSFLFPFDWNPVTKQLSRTKSRRKLSWYYLRFVLNVAYAFSLLIAGCPHPETDLGHISGILGIYAYVLLLFGQLQLIPLWIVTRNRLEEFLTFTRQLQQLGLNVKLKGQKPSAPTRTLEKDKPKVNEGKVNFCERILQSIFTGAKASQGALVLLLLLTHDSRRCHVECLIPAQHRGKLTFVLFFVFEACMGIQTANNAVFALGLGYVYWVKSTHILRELCSYENAAEAKAEAPYGAIRKYRSLQLLNTMFNVTLAQTFVPVLKTIAQIGAPILITVCIKLATKDGGGGGGASTLFVALLIVFSLTVTVSLVEFAPILPLAQTYEMSISFKKALALRLPTSDDEDAAYFMAIALKRSCRVLRNNVGQLYFVDRSLILTMIKFKIDAVIFLLLNIT